MDHEEGVKEPIKSKQPAPTPVPSSGVKNITFAKGKNGGQPRILLQGLFLEAAGFKSGGTYSYVTEDGKITLQVES